jgi:DNA-directed RNA polymerase subunit RPC12/RpoP
MTQDTWSDEETAGMKVYKCKSCGGEIIADETTGASKCPYCDNPVVMTGQFSGDLKPEFIIPFKYDKEAAKKALTEHFKGKKLLPKVFTDQHQIDEIKGVYVPVWLFDASAAGEFRYKAAKIKRWSDENYDYVKYDYYMVKRAGTIAFEQVPVDGSKKMDDDLMESIEPFDFKGAVPFQPAYMAGYLADKYDVNAEESIDRANERIRHSVEKAFRDTVTGYETVDTENSSIQLDNAKAKYAMYPVWLLNISWNGQTYPFAMNGQTGKFVGNLPADKGLAVKKFILIAVILTIVFTVLGMLIGLG